MNYEDLIFSIATSISPSLLIFLTISFLFDMLRGLLFPAERWN